MCLHMEWCIANGFFGVTLRSINVDRVNVNVVSDSAKVVPKPGQKPGQKPTGKPSTQKAAKKSTPQKAAEAEISTLEKNAKEAVSAAKQIKHDMGEWVGDHFRNL